MQEPKTRFMISGLFRSGTTFLARALNCHPNLIVASDPFFELFKETRNIWFSSSNASFDESQPLEDYFFKGYSYFTPFLDEFHRIRFSEDQVEKLRSRIPRTAAPFSPKILPFLETLKAGSTTEILSDLYNIVGKAYFKSEAKCIGTKHVWTDEFSVPLTKNNYKFIQIVRDPRAVVASNKVSETGAYPVLFLIRQWRKSAAFAFQQRQNPNHLLLTYEQLIQDPVPTFKRIFELLQIDFDDSVLNANNYKDGEGKSWSQNSSYGSRNTINDQWMKKWIDVLNESEKDLIESLCCFEMKELGYDVEERSFPLRSMLEYSLPQEIIADWIRNYNFGFDQSNVLKELLRYQLLEEAVPITVSPEDRKRILLFDA